MPELYVVFLFIKILYVYIAFVSVIFQILANVIPIPVGMEDHVRLLKRLTHTRVHVPKTSLEQTVRKQNRMAFNIELLRTQQHGVMPKLNVKDGRVI